MKLLLKLALIATFLSLPLVAQKPDSAAKPETKPSATPKLPAAKEIVDKYVKAIGGREALMKHKTRVQTGTLELSPMNIKGTIESFSRSDDRSLTKISLAGVGDLIDGYDGKTAWTANPIQGNRVKEGKELEQSKRNSAFAREAMLDKIYSSLTVRGIEKVGERDAYVIVAATDGLPDDILYFDTETGLMLRSDSIVITPEGNQAMNSFYEDYREVEGIKSAFRIKAKTPAFEINTVFSEIKYGVPIEDSKFVQPK